jgi:adenylate cyclase
MQTAIIEPTLKHQKLVPARAYVLVVDDEEQNRILLRDPLEARGFHVKEAQNGAEALEAIAERLPDVILLDLMMPGMDGFEVCRRLKSNSATAPIPILIVTALSERKERLMGIEAGANDFLNKPVDIADLLLRVANAAHSKALFDQLQAEREKSDQLLLNILPKAIARRMKAGETTIADSHSEASVLVADLAGFTTVASHIPAEQVVFLLNEIFSAFDSLLEKHALEKIKTIGDAYMVAAGVPVPRPDHPGAIVELALEMTRELEQFNEQYDTSLRIRIGISTGPVVAGVIGRKRFSYDLWGDTVNIAFRLESLVEPGGILVDQATFDLVKENYSFGPPRTLELKGRGNAIAYRLEGRL